MRLLAASAVLERAGADHIERKLRAAPWWELRRRARLSRELEEARKRELKMLARLRGQTETEHARETSSPTA